MYFKNGSLVLRIEIAVYQIPIISILDPQTSVAKSRFSIRLKTRHHLSKDDRNRTRTETTIKTKTSTPHLYTVYIYCTKTHPVFVPWQWITNVT